MATTIWQPFFQPVDLPLHIGPAVHAGNAHRRHKVGQILQVPGDLLGQLPSGGQNHRLRAGKFFVERETRMVAVGGGALFIFPIIS